LFANDVKLYIKVVDCSDIAKLQQALFACFEFPSVLWHCWLGDSKNIRPVKKWVLVCWRWQFTWCHHHFHHP